VRACVRACARACLPCTNPTRTHCRFANLLGTARDVTFLADSLSFVLDRTVSAYGVAGVSLGAHSAIITAAHDSRFELWYVRVCVAHRLIALQCVSDRLCGHTRADEGSHWQAARRRRSRCRPRRRAHAGVCRVRAALQRARIRRQFSRAQTAVRGRDSRPSETLARVCVRRLTRCS
jgi:hypothetical protein